MQYTDSWLLCHQQYDMSKEPVLRQPQQSNYKNTIGNYQNIKQIIIETTSCCRTLNSCITVSNLQHYTSTTPQPFYGPFSGARRELLDFMVQGEINRGRHTDHPAGRHSIRTNQCPPPTSPHSFYGPDALPAAQPTVSKH